MTAAPEFDDFFRSQLRELLAWRRDVRHFRRNPLPENAVERLIDIACLAPSVGLSQPWRFVLVEAPERRDAIAKNFAECNAAALARQSADRAAHYARLKLAGLDDAPCHLAVFVDPATERGHGLGRLTMPETIAYSAVAAINTIWLVARAEGIGMGWVSILDPSAVTAALDVPAEWQFVGYFCIGYPQDEDDVPALERAKWERRSPAASELLRR